MSKIRHPYDIDETSKRFMKSTPTPSNPEPRKVSSKFNLKINEQPTESNESTLRHN